ncbi:hypothetical protein EHV15_28385 [Paenibacillus oralis]|uniref:Uncharacterized protein n=1 Tax=Paenibacillus oralis TaxID=2490856 RepID=A0A3P3UD76_9BACL|nr:hypothetical protein [Paenibacillus oralis]RRJ66403.1 hypothetical protein EHV15_28385 [Paenibacillus oralis]
MAGVAINGSEINESVKSGHVTYDIQRRRDTDEGPKWVDAGSGSTGAKITGSVSVSSSRLKIEGENVATVGDKTNETWEAYPPIPSSTSSRRYTATSPTRGSGQGKITSGSTRGKLGGKAIALIGSRVETCLGTITTIKDGNEKVKFES